jgi:hypothetical protein
MPLFFAKTLMKTPSFRRSRIFLALNAAFAAALVLAPTARADDIL